MMFLKRFTASALCLLLCGGRTAGAVAFYTEGAAKPIVIRAAPILAPSLVPLAAPAGPALARVSLAAPQVRLLALPQPPRLSAPQAKADLDSRWEGKAPQAAVEAVAEAAPAPSPALAAPAAPAPLPARRIPAPRVLAARAKIVAGWTALTGLATLTHAPYDRVAPLVIAVFMSAAVSFMALVFAGSMQRAVAQPAAPPTGPPGEEAAVRAKLDRLAALVGLPPAKRFQLVDSPALQAQAGGTPGDYEVTIYKGLLSLPEDQQEAVMRHELGHVKHQDSTFTAVTFALAPLAPTIALLSGVLSDDRGWWTLPFAAAALAGFGASKKLDEFHADQFAAHTQGTAEPLKRFFKDDLAREEKPSGPLLRVRAAWRRLASVVASHPSHERRIERLERLGLR